MPIKGINASCIDMLIEQGLSYKSMLKLEQTIATTVTTKMLDMKLQDLRKALSLLNLITKRAMLEQGRREWLGHLMSLDREYLYWFLYLCQ